jgi:hypothetical protein
LESKRAQTPFLFIFLFVFLLASMVASPANADGQLLELLEMVVRQPATDARRGRKSASSSGFAFSRGFS